MSNINCSDIKTPKFNIQQLTRLREDNCYIKTENNTIVKPGKYTIKNFKTQPCRAPDTKCLSLDQPSTFYRDGFGWTSKDGCNIDDDSNLRNARNITNYREIHQLYSRPYKTVPYMGRGSGNVCAESDLRSSEDTFQNKACNNLAGISIDRKIPQIPCIRNNIQNPKYIIPEDSDKFWVRGGQPSRQVIRNSDYLKKCGYKYNGKLWIR
tara:strand:- start:917 stop:1543 length:627 start_codon:yes stop_codon:yes gene_type:complete